MGLDCIQRCTSHSQIHTSSKTLSDTKLWKSLQAKADEIMESAKIYLSNRIERDAKLLASVGLFAWDRAVRDVTRTLPAAGTSGASVGRAMRKAALQLGNSSSFDEMQAILKETRTSLRERTVLDELNSPLDEIKSVTQSIRAILNGEAPTFSSGRSLRTVAPAGQSKMAERQRRAYARRKQTTLKNEGTVNIGLSNLVDAAWEMKRELEVETSQPGYRTETFRNAIEAGAQTTARVIGAAQEGRSLRQALFGGMDTSNPVMLGSAAVIEDVYDTMAEVIRMDDEMEDIEIQQAIYTPIDLLLPDSLLDEQYNVVLRIRKCIEQPDETWLSADVLESIDTQIDEANLRETVTAMICARDNLEEEEESMEISDINQIVGQLNKVKRTVDSIISLAATSAGFVAAGRLSDVLYGTDQSNGAPAVLLSIEDIRAQYEIDLKSSIEEAISKTKRRQRDIEASNAEDRLGILSERAASEQVDEDDAINAHTGAIGNDVEYESAAIEEAEEGVGRKVWFATVIEALECESLEYATRGGTGSVLNNVFTDDESDVLTAEFTDVLVTNTEMSNVWPENSIDESDIKFSVVEVVTDSEYDSLKAAAAGEDDNTDEVSDLEKNALVTLALRSLDILVLVIEKVVLSGIPNMLVLGTTASKRLDEISRGGRGRIGWSRLENVQTGSKRY